MYGKISIECIILQHRGKVVHYVQDADVEKVKFQVITDVRDNEVWEKYGVTCVGDAAEKVKQYGLVGGERVIVSGTLEHKLVLDRDMGVETAISHIFNASVDVICSKVPEKKEKCPAAASSTDMPNVAVPELQKDDGHPRTSVAGSTLSESPVRASGCAASDARVGSVEAPQSTPSPKKFRDAMPEELPFRSKKPAEAPRS